MGRPGGRFIFETNTPGIIKIANLRYLGGEVRYLGLENKIISNVDLSVKQAGEDDSQASTDNSGKYVFKINPDKDSIISADANGHLATSSIDLIDITKVGQHIALLSSFSKPEEWVAADVNRDLLIDGLDISAMLKVALGNENIFPYQEPVSSATEVTVRVYENARLGNHQNGSHYKSTNSYFSTDNPGAVSTDLQDQAFAVAYSAAYGHPTASWRTLYDTSTSDPFVSAYTRGSDGEIRPSLKSAIGLNVGGGLHGGSLFVLEEKINDILEMTDATGDAFLSNSDNYTSYTFRFGGDNYPDVNPTSNWVFVNPDFFQIDPSTALFNLGPYRTLNIEAGMDTDKYDAHMGAILLGDVDGSLAEQTSPYSARQVTRASLALSNTLEFRGIEMDENGQLEVEVHGLFDQGIMGVQFDLAWDPSVLQLESMNAPQLSGFDQNRHFSLRDGEGTFLWFDPRFGSTVIDAQNPVVVLRFSALEGATQGTMIHINKPKVVPRQRPRRFH